jgi:glyoxylase-like metal-dependent hydrolase (beta-lactamase superfamily II)/rhodanese-related sulfurtransferase
MKKIDVETLREWLEEGRPVTVLDIREDQDYRETAIPGSTHFDVYQALKSGDPHALDHVHPPAGVPVVTVCGRGQTSQIAAEQLEARGIETLSLEGGMKAWSLAWNTADVVLPFRGDVQVLQVRRSAKGCLSYVLASDGRAIVIDPSIEPEIYAQLAQARSWKIQYVLETHIHADHLSRGRQLAELVNAELVLPINGRTTFPHTPLGDGQTLRIGEAQVTALHTPGHTPESTSYLLDQAAVFTGDTLFLNGVGRPDLHNDSEQRQAAAGMLYRSVQQLLTLGPRTLILPGHTNHPVAFDEAPITASLEQVRAENKLLASDEESFVRAIAANVMPTPANYESITRFNESGTTPEGDPTDLESGANRCAIS